MPQLRPRYKLDLIYKPSFLLANLKSQSTSTTESNTEKPAATPPSLLSFPFVFTNHPTSLSSISHSFPNNAHPNIPSLLTISTFTAPSMPRALVAGDSRGTAESRPCRRYSPALALRLQHEPRRSHTLNSALRIESPHAHPARPQGVEVDGGDLEGQRARREEAKRRGDVQDTGVRIDGGRGSEHESVFE
ncbi:hypothetical protein A0H81_08850 [Grifola frondosa]|uniref:Uncharacterized protein n=1 Tax=Grifola frondosa TaxID=5627 RepID=A0A1C7M4H5_GRIFR|nr:hypothetical protein A0H81_08850 [Grifola frondosa]